MIHKVMDRGRVVHYNVIGYLRLVALCEIRYPWLSFVLPASWRRTVDCMTCLVRAASLAWCGHGSGEVVRIDSQYGVSRQCHRCAGTLVTCNT